MSGTPDQLPGVSSAAVNRSARALGLEAAVTIVGFDQVSKAWLLDYLTAPSRVVELAPFVSLVPVWNTGISFGLFADLAMGGVELAIVALAIVAGLLWWLARIETRMAGCAIGLVVGGALGNVIDRLRFGAVFDFLDLHWGDWHWPAFNLADAAITVGVVLLLLDGLFPTARSVK